MLVFVILCSKVLSDWCTGLSNCSSRISSNNSVAIIESKVLRMCYCSNGNNCAMTWLCSAECFPEKEQRREADGCNNSILWRRWQIRGAFRRQTSISMLICLEWPRFGIDWSVRNRGSWLIRKFSTRLETAKATAIVCALACTCGKSHYVNQLCTDWLHLWWIQCWRSQESSKYKLQPLEFGLLYIWQDFRAISYIWENAMRPPFNKCSRLETLKCSQPA